MNSNGHVVAVVDMQDLEKYLYRCITIFFCKCFFYSTVCVIIIILVNLFLCLPVSIFTRTTVHPVLLHL